MSVWHTVQQQFKNRSHKDIFTIKGLNTDDENSSTLKLYKNVIQIAIKLELIRTHKRLSYLELNFKTSRKTFQNKIQSFRTHN